MVTFNFNIVDENKNFNEFYTQFKNAISKFSDPNDN